MIAIVMLAATFASALFVVAAYCAERALGALGKATRMPWILACVGAVTVPAAQLLALTLLPAASRVASATNQPLPLVTILGVQDGARLVSVDRWLAAAWITASLFLALRLLVLRRALWREALTWTRAEIGGTRVWLSSDCGPALVGLRNPQVVVPRCFVQLPVEQQRLAVSHELEHAKSHDQWFVWGAALAVTAVPWNLPLWLAARRVRAAVEIDCDARVLRSEPNVETYASLVLSVASWPRGTRAGAVALGETGLTQLERRLRIMTSDKTRRRLVAALGLLAVAVSSVIYGCEVATNVQHPASSGMVEVPKAQVNRAVGDGPYFEFQVTRPVTQAPDGTAPKYPDVLRQAGVEGEVLVQFVVDAKGQPDPVTFKVLQSTHELFSQAVQRALPGMRFVPAQLDGRSVMQVVQQPFSFKIAR